MNKKGLQDYHEIKKPDGSRSWEYTGNYYCIQSDNLSIKSIKIRFFVYSLLTVLLIFFEGFLDPGSLRTLYCIIPFLAVFFFSLRSLMQSFGLYRAKEKLTFRQKEKYLSGLYMSFRVLLILSVVLFVTQAIYLFIDTANLKDFVALALTAFVFALTYINYKLSKAHPCKLDDLAMQISGNGN